MSHNILIVDDSATTRAMIKRIINLCGIPTESILQAADGAEALGVLRASKVDLVLADLHMPNMGGVEMTRRMMADPAMRNIPVVVVSADPNAKRIDQLKREGVKGYLAKPFTPEAFREVLGQTLGVHANA
jgi:two-component system chemotaxis response regulator CheY